MSEFHFSFTKLKAIVVTSQSSQNRLKIAVILAIVTVKVVV